MYYRFQTIVALLIGFVCGTITQQVVINQMMHEAAVVEKQKFARLVEEWQVQAFAAQTELLDHYRKECNHDRTSHAVGLPVRKDD